jgi:hypothetical protein
VNAEGHHHRCVHCGHEYFCDLPECRPIDGSFYLACAKHGGAFRQDPETRPAPVPHEHRPRHLKEIAL